MKSVQTHNEKWAGPVPGSANSSTTSFECGRRRPVLIGARFPDVLDLPVASFFDNVMSARSCSVELEIPRSDASGGIP